jgi:hypothetical protein
MPPYMRRSPKVAEVLPVLYLRGLSTPMRAGELRDHLFEIQAVYGIMRRRPNPQLLPIAPLGVEMVWMVHTAQPAQICSVLQSRVSTPEKSGGLGSLF